MLLPFQNPSSVIQRAPMSGVFGISADTIDKDGFITHVLGHWYCLLGNTIPAEGPQHIEAAERLYELYVEYRQHVENGLKGGYLVLHKLYQSANIDEARKVLKGLVSS